MHAVLMYAKKSTKSDVRLNDDKILSQTGISMADNYSSINEPSGPSNRLGDIASASVMNWITVDQGRICYRWILDSEAD